MKKVISFIVTACMVVVFAACQDNAEKPRDITGYLFDGGVGLLCEYETYETAQAGGTVGETTVYTDAQTGTQITLPAKYLALGTAIGRNAEMTYTHFGSGSEGVQIINWRTDKTLEQITEQAAVKQEEITWRGDATMLCDLSAEKGQMVLLSQLGDGFVQIIGFTTAYGEAELCRALFNSASVEVLSSAAWNALYENASAPLYTADDLMGIIEIDERYGVLERDALGVRIVEPLTGTQIKMSGYMCPGHKLSEADGGLLYIFGEDGMNRGFSYVDTPYLNLFTPQDVIDTYDYLPEDTQVEIDGASYTLRYQTQDGNYHAEKGIVMDNGMTLRVKIMVELETLLNMVDLTVLEPGFEAGLTSAQPALEGDVFKNAHGFSAAEYRLAYSTDAAAWVAMSIDEKLDLCVAVQKIWEHYGEDAELLLPDDIEKSISANILSGGSALKAACVGGEIDYEKYGYRTVGK